MTGKVEFGTDDWGKWAAGVEVRFKTQAEAAAVAEAARAEMLKRIEALEAAPKNGKVVAVKGGEDLEVRMRALEMLSGIAQKAGKHDEGESGDA